MRPLDVALDRQHPVDLRQHFLLVHRRGLEELRHLLRLLLHAPLQLHDSRLQLLNGVRDRLSLIGTEADALLMLHHQLGRENVTREVLRVFALCAERWRHKHRESECETYKTRNHDVLRLESLACSAGRASCAPNESELKREPKLGTVDSSSLPGVSSRKSVGEVQRSAVRNAR